jgi:hypothetical protein
MDRTEVLELMAKLKLYGMRATFAVRLLRIERY